MKRVKIIPLKIIEEEQKGIAFRRKRREQKGLKIDSELTYPEFLEIDDKGVCINEASTPPSGHIMLHRYKGKYYLSEGVFDEPNEPDEWIYTRYVGTNFKQAFRRMMDLMD